nr:chitin deacetylase [Polyrhizophydium stewartii]
MSLNPSTYSSVGTISEVHDVGEVWTAMLWDMYWGIVDKSGFNANVMDVNLTAGNIATLRIVSDSFKYMPCNPTMVEARNAILISTIVLYNNQYLCTIWRSFARLAPADVAAVAAIASLPVTPDNTCGAAAGYDLDVCSQDHFCGGQQHDLVCQAVVVLVVVGQANEQQRIALSAADKHLRLQVAEPERHAPEPEPEPERPAHHLPISPDETCGAAAGYTCGPYKCCSQYGYCGTTTDYCDVQTCQPLYGACGTIPARTTTAAATGTSPLPPWPTDHPPLTPDGRCGPDNGGYTCGSSACCSSKGRCGTTEAYCLSSNGCILGFGFCGTNITVPNDYPPVDPSKQAAWITSCNREGVFAMTFDDGPADNFPAVLDALKANGMRATFFVNGNNFADLTVEPYISYLKRAYNEGHQIGSHTLTHPDLLTLDTAHIWYEVKTNDELIKPIIGKRPVYFRPPFGNVNADIMNALGTWGYKVIWINIDSRDFEHEGQSNFVALNTASYNDDIAAIGAVFPKTSFISLQHDHIAGEPDWINTVAKRFKALGYSFVTVGECLNDPQANWYRD